MKMAEANRLIGEVIFFLYRLYRNGKSGIFHGIDYAICCIQTLKLVLLYVCMMTQLSSTTHAPVIWYCYSKRCAVVNFKFTFFLKI